MIFSPTKWLITFLALLQLVAPLMHAHASGEPSDHGVHIPGLEHFSINNNEPDSLVLQHPLCNEATVVSVGAAIKQSKVFSNKTPAFSLPTEVFKFSIVINQLAHIDAQYPQKNYIATAHYTLLPTRAPPLKI